MCGAACVGMAIKNNHRNKNTHETNSIEQSEPVSQSASERTSKQAKMNTHTQNKNIMIITKTTTAPEKTAKRQQ